MVSSGRGDPACEPSDGAVVGWGQLRVCMATPCILICYFKTKVIKNRLTQEPKPQGHRPCLVADDTLTLTCVLSRIGTVGWMGVILSQSLQFTLSA